MGDENYVAWSDRLRAEGMEKGIEALVLDGLEEQKTEQQIIAKLVKRFGLTEDKAKEYFEKYSLAQIK